MTSSNGLFCKRNRVVDMTGDEYKARTIRRAQGRAQKGDDLRGILTGVHLI